MKKKWHKPTLVVLSKGSAEEQVLDNCKKGINDGDTGQGQSEYKCMSRSCCGCSRMRLT